MKEKTDQKEHKGPRLEEWTEESKETGRERTERENEGKEVPSKLRGRRSF